MKTCVFCKNETDEYADYYTGRYEKESKRMNFHKYSEPICKKCAETNYARRNFKGMWISIFLQLFWFNFVIHGLTVRGLFSLLLALSGLYRILLFVVSKIHFQYYPDKPIPVLLMLGFDYKKVASEMLTERNKEKLSQRREHVFSLREYQQHRHSASKNGN